MIVIGTHGRAGISRLVLGSTAESMVRHAPCPVLVVKPHLQRDCSGNVRYLAAEQAKCQERENDGRDTNVKPVTLSDEPDHRDDDAGDRSGHEQ